MLEPLLYFCGTMLATLAVAVVVCRYLASHGKQVSWGAVLASSIIANVGVFLGFGFYEEGLHLFTSEAWVGGKGGLGEVFIVVGVLTAFCILPALGVAVYFQRRAQTREKHTI